MINTFYLKVAKDSRVYNYTPKLLQEGEFLDRENWHTGKFTKSWGNYSNDQDSSNSYDSLKLNYNYALCFIDIYLFNRLEQSINYSFCPPIAQNLNFNDES